MSGPQDRLVSELQYSSEQNRSNSDFAILAAPKRVMLIIPGRLFRNGIELVLRQTGSHIISDCETLEQAEAALQGQSDLQPDLFVIGMDQLGRAVEDFTRIRALRTKMPEARWIVLSNCGGPEFWWQAVESRIDGLLHPDSPGEVLQLLVRLILLGYSFLPSSTALAQRQAMPIRADQASTTPALPEPTMLEMFKVPERPLFPGSTSPNRWRAGLSDRESDILRGLVAGQSNKSIARELNISEATVKVHVKALLRKMQVTNRTQAAISALQFLNKPGQESQPIPPFPAPTPNGAGDLT